MPKSLLPPIQMQPWDSRLREMFRRYRQALRAHPHALPVLSTHPPSTPKMLRQEEAAVAILHDIGFSPLEAAQMIGCLGGYVVGMTLQEVGVQPGGVPDPSAEEVMAQVAQLSPVEFPVLTAVFRSGFPFDADAGFESGLDHFIAGIKARHRAIARGADETTARRAQARPRAPATSRGRARRG